MIIDQSRIISGTSVSRMSEYLSLCKIDCLVRKIDLSIPSCRVDQPSKVGKARTMSNPNYRSDHRCSLRVDITRKLGNKRSTLYLKNELSKQSGLIIKSLTEVGTVILQQDGKDLCIIPLYKVLSSVDNFAANKRKEWSFCLVDNKQDMWVKSFMNLARKNRLQSDYLINIRQGQIWYHKIPKVVKGGS